MPVLPTDMPIRNHPGVSDNVAEAKGAWGREQVALAALLIRLN